MDKQNIDTLILVSGRGTDFTYTFPDHIHGRNLELALVTLSTYYSWPNIHSGNNQIVIKNNILDARNKGAIKSGDKTITIPKGAYGLDDINNVIKSQLVDQDAFDLQANENTLKSVITLKAGYSVDFHNSSLRTILGFNSKDITGPGVFVSDNKVDITDVNEVLINVDIIDGVYQPRDSKFVRGHVIESFYPSVAPGYKVSIEKRHLFYSPVLKDHISRMRVWLTSQDGVPIDNGLERLDLKFHLKSKKSNF